MSTQDSHSEANSTIGVLPTIDLTEQFRRLIPAEWQSLPKADSQGFSGHGKVQMFSMTCKSPIPTDDEVNSLISHIQQAGRPIAWLVTMAAVVLPTWPEGQDPTVKDFLEGNMNAENITPKHIILSYPIMELNK